MMVNETPTTLRKGCLLSTLVSFGLVLGVCQSARYFIRHNDVTRYDSGSITLRKEDFPRGHTTFHIDKQRILVRQKDRGLNARKYVDANADGVVDSFTCRLEDNLGVENDFFSVTYESLKPEQRWAFDIIQKDYTEQIRRFEPLLKKHRVWPYTQAPVSLEK